MLFTASAAIAFGMNSVLANPFTNQTMACRSSPSLAKIAAAEAHFASHKVLKKTAGNATFAVTIPVYWHTIQSGNDLSEGNTPQSQITASIDVLNKDFTGSGLTFRLEKIEHITNAEWFDWAQQDTAYQTMMKQTLRKGNESALNVYTVGFRDYVGTGYATFPAHYSDAPMDDGVVLRYTTLPGGTYDPWNKGRILTHEVGHWVGLYHTFQGGCSEPGDYVDDTPPQDEQSPTSGCPIGKDTCPGGGPDPIHNHMDYSDDSCKTEFTPGQIARLQAQLITYRGV